MAHKGIGFFDNRGHFFKSPEDATLSDLAALLGKIGDGESLAPGIAHLLLDRRADLERIFTEHDEMKSDQDQWTVLNGATVTSIAEKRNGAAH